MKQESFYRIYGWMRHAPYGLRGTTLEVYAALYDLTRKEEKVYSRAWLCEWLEMPNTTLGRALRDLKKAGLLSLCEVSKNTYALQALKLCQNGTSACQNGTSACQNGTSSCQNGTSSCQNGTEHLIYGDTNVSLIRKQIKNTGERATRDASPKEAEKIPPSRAEEKEIQNSVSPEIQDSRFKIQESAPLPLQVTRGRAARVAGDTAEAPLPPEVTRGRAARVPGDTAEAPLPPRGTRGRAARVPGDTAEAALPPEVTRGRAARVAGDTAETPLPSRGTRGRAARVPGDTAEITKEDVWGIAQELRMSAEVAGAFYYYYAAAGWRLSRGKPITKGNLRHALMLWDIRQRELERRHGGRVSSHGNHTVTTRRGDVVAGVVLTMDEYYQRFGTTEVQEGWRMENPTGEKMVYVKI